MKLLDGGVALLLLFGLLGAVAVFNGTDVNDPNSSGDIVKFKNWVNSHDQRCYPERTGQRYYKYCNQKELDDIASGRL
jgi:hypothetical protein